MMTVLCFPSVVTMPDTKIERTSKPHKGLTNGKGPWPVEETHSGESNWLSKLNLQPVVPVERRRAQP